MGSPTTKKIIIRVIVALFLISSGLWFVLYFTPSFQALSEERPDEDVPTQVEEYVEVNDVKLISIDNTDIDVDVPENNDIQVIMTELEESDEMDIMIEVILEDGSIDTPTMGDFSDSLQLVE